MGFLLPAIMGASSIIGAIGRHKSAKNQQKKEEDINNRRIGLGDKALGYIGDDRGKYSDLMTGAGSGQYDFNPTFFNPSTTPARMNESQDFYRNAMGTGLYSQSDINDFRNRQALGNTATFDAVRRGLGENAAIRGGGYSGYNNQLAKLTRDKARELEAGRLGAETTLQEAIRGNKFRGAEGVQANDRDYTGQLRANTDIENQYSSMNNNIANEYGSANVNNRFNRQVGLLDAMGNSTRGYLGIAGQNYNVQPSEEVQPWWGTLASGVGQAAGAAMGAGYGAQKRVKPGVGVIPSTKYSFNQTTRY